MQRDEDLTGLAAQINHIAFLARRVLKMVQYLSLVELAQGVCWLASFQGMLKQNR